jgi:hypothetical protein
MKKDSATEREAEGAWSCPLGLLTPSKGKSLMMSIGIFSAWRASSLLGLSGITRKLDALWIENYAGGTLLGSNPSDFHLGLWMAARVG